MVDVKMLGGASATLGTAEIATLGNGLLGKLLVSTDQGYDAARRVWNGNVDRRPSVIVQCKASSDVQQAVRFASTRQLLTSVRGGGHSAPGYGTNDGGLVIDLSLMKAISVDPVKRTARAEGGVLWRELDGATQAHAAKWQGDVVYDGSTYAGNITMIDANTLRMAGCAGIACESMVFNRV